MCNSINIIITLFIFSIFFSACQNKKYCFDFDSFGIKDENKFIEYSSKYIWRVEETGGTLNQLYPIKMIRIANKNHLEWDFYHYGSISNPHKISLDTLDPSWNVFTVSKDSLESTFPKEYKKYMPPLLDSVTLTWYTIKDTIKKGLKNINSEKVFSYHFPDTLGLLTDGFLMYTRNPYILIIDPSFSKQHKIKRRMSYYISYLILNPSFHLYESSIFAVWGDYVTKYNATPEIYAKRKLKARKYQRKFEKFIRHYFEKDHYSMHKSYFELILWQVYKPNNFKLKDNLGMYRSFIFNSCNPDYPEIYEVKFNIYKPYCFKVFKR